MTVTPTRPCWRGSTGPSMASCAPTPRELPKVGCTLRRTRAGRGTACRTEVPGKPRSPSPGCSRRGLAVHAFRGETNAEQHPSQSKRKSATPRVSHASHPHQEGWDQLCTVAPPNVLPHCASRSSAPGHGGSRCWSAFCSGYGRLHVRSTYGRSTLFSQVPGASGEPVSQAGWQ
jgi:hypothetical protein